jgi:hypothetical protein
MKAQIRVDLRPNNQITITVGSWKKTVLPVYQDYKPDACPVDFNERLQARIDESAGRRLYYDAMKPYYREKISTLDITKKSQRSKKAPYMKLNRPKSFTRFSGQRVRECGAACSIACNGDMRFANEVTLTLPANTHEAFTALAAYSGYAINRLFQPIRRKYGDDCLWFFVWEYQKRGALHLHICTYHPDEMEGLLISAQLIEQWHKILVDISELSQVCMFLDKRRDRCTVRSSHQHHTSQIKKDVGAYFAKYAGKEESKDSWYIQKYPVSRFWGSSRSLKRIVRENSLRFDFDYQGNEKEAIEKYSRLIENIIEKLSIVKASTYEFYIAPLPKAQMRIYKNRGKILSISKGRPFAEGERSTFYFSQMEFKKAMELIKEECQWF